MDDKKPVFEGFRKPDKHFYHMPNEWTDIMADIDNLAELKVIEYLIRHTWGFKEYDQFKFITIDEFMYGRLRFDGARMDKGTGLKSDRSVKDGLKAAIEHGYVLCEPNTKAKVKKSYKLKMQWVDSTQDVGSNYPEKSQDLPTSKVESTHKSPSGEKETETKIKESKKERLIHSFDHSSLPSVSLDQCLDAVESFAEAYGDRDPVACRLEAEQLYRVSGLDSNAFWDEMFAVKETLGKKSQTMGIFFKRLRKELGREH